MLTHHPASVAKKTRQKHTIHVVSHTHWDREWYLSFQELRFHLVRLVDQLLEILDNDPDFRCFMLDGQSIVIDDYLALRPENKSRLTQYIGSGRILVGPWYVLPDLFLVGGESIIRNLQIGISATEALGGVMLVGYMPDQFGFVSQMPQILDGAGLTSAVVWRGIDNVPSEFSWKSPDGTEVLTIHLDEDLGYFSGAEIGSLSPLDRANEISKICEKLEQRAGTKHLLLMNGVDHKFPDIHLTRILDEANLSLERYDLVHSSIPDYVTVVAQELEDLTTIEGELRRSAAMEIFQGTLSSRMYLKQANERAETLLQHVVEPLCTFAWLSGYEYPHAFLKEAWRILIQNHAHDSICGCGTDELHREMETRYLNVQQIGRSLIEQAVSHVVAGSPASELEQESTPSLVVFNTLPWRRSDVVEADVVLTGDGADAGFTLLDGDAPVHYGVVEIEKQYVGVNHARSIEKFPAFDWGTRYRIVFSANDVPPCGYRAYRIACLGGISNPSQTSNPSPARDGNVPEESLTEFLSESGLPGVETPQLRLTFNEDGTFDLLDRAAGQSYLGLHYFEDEGDRGDEYNYCRPAQDLCVTSRGGAAEVELAASGHNFRIFRIRQTLNVPKGLEPDDRDRRSRDLTEIEITSLITIASSTGRVDIRTELNNTARDHRLRVVFPTNLSTGHSVAESAFEVVTRPIDLPDFDGWKEDPERTQPQQNFVDVTGGGHGLLIANRGLREYEVSADSERAILLTLLRCVEWGSRGDLPNVRRGRDDKGDSVGNFLFTPDAQCPGKHTFHYSIVPHAGDAVSSGAYRQAYEHKVDLLPFARDVSPDAPSLHSFFSVNADGVLLSAAKVAEETGDLVLRLFSLAGESRTATVAFDRPVAQAHWLDMLDRRTGSLAAPQSERSIQIAIRRHAITTLGLQPESRIWPRVVLAKPIADFCRGTEAAGSFDGMTDGEEIF